MTFYYKIGKHFVHIQIFIWFNTEIKTSEPSDLSHYESVKPEKCLSKHPKCNKVFILSLCVKIYHVLHTKC